MAIEDYLPQAQDKTEKARKKEEIRAAGAQKLLTNTFNNAQMTEKLAAEAIANQGDITIEVDNYNVRPVKNFKDFFGAVADFFKDVDYGINEADVQNNPAYQAYCATLSAYGCQVEKINVRTKHSLASSSPIVNVCMSINHDKTVQAALNL